MREMATVICLCMALGSPGCGSDAAPSVFQTNIADGELRISVLTTLDVTSLEGLDPASVNDDAVTLIDEFGNVVRGDVSYDADTETVSFRPLNLLKHGMRYHWQLANLRAADGQSLPDHHVRFTTYFNRLLQYTQYDGDEVFSYETSVYESDYLAVQVSYRDPGPDGVWFTSDDDIDGYSRFLRDEHHRTIDITFYDDTGGDGVWMTDDDVKSYYIQYIRGDNGRSLWAVTYVDGEIATIRDDVYRPDGEVDSMSLYTSWGPDQTWFTDDDVRSLYLRSEYDERGRLVRRMTVTGPGADGEWFTDDDIVNSHVTSTYDDIGQVTRRVNYRDPGPDGEWFTDDDIPSSYTELRYDTRGNQIEWRSFSPGPDGEIMTADDQLTALYEYDTSR